jgi:co-chaperonin GroES (HSP10)
MSEKIINIPEGAKPLNLMSDEVRVTAEAETLAIMDRIDKEKEDLRAQEVIIDGSNTVGFPGYPYKFTACGEKIIVVIDVFKSGYECKVCNGRKKVDIKCWCEIDGHAGLRYAPEEIDEIRKTLGPSIADAREAIKCNICLGDYIAFRREETCTACKGKGAILILPNESEALAHTGTVVSIGTLAAKLIEDEGWEYKIGDKILFGPHAGNFIPTKSGMLLKILDYNQAWLKIEGASDLDAFDFILKNKS